MQLSVGLGQAFAAIDSRNDAAVVLRGALETAQPGEQVVRVLRRFFRWGEFTITGIIRLVAEVAGSSEFKSLKAARHVRNLVNVALQDELGIDHRGRRRGVPHPKLANAMSLAVAAYYGLDPSIIVAADEVMSPRLLVRTLDLYTVHGACGQGNGLGALGTHRVSERRADSEIAVISDFVKNDPELEEFLKGYRAKIGPHTIGGLAWLQAHKPPGKQDVEDLHAQAADMACQYALQNCRTPRQVQEQMISCAEAFATLEAEVMSGLL